MLHQLRKSLRKRAVCHERAQRSDKIRRPSHKPAKLVTSEFKCRNQTRTTENGDVSKVFIFTLRGFVVRRGSVRDPGNAKVKERTRLNLERGETVQVKLYKLSKSIFHKEARDDDEPVLREGL